MPKISAIFPAYNKESVIEDALADAHRELIKTNLPFEMIIVNDGSEDETKSKIENFCKNYGEAKLLDLPKNMGKGHALLQGYQASRGELLLFMDADKDLDPERIHTFLSYLNKHNVDIVIGSKNHPDSVITYPTSRKILSRCYQLLNFALFSLPVSDTQVGFKLMKRQVLDFAHSRMVVKRFAFALELLVLAHKKGFKIKEAPIELRYTGFSCLKPSQIFKIGLDTAAIWYRLNILNYYKI